jgi:hypothetical protein
MKETPPRLVEDGRVVAFGHFRSPFRTNNVIEADVFGLGRLGSRVVNPLRLKDWQHFAVFGPDLLLTFVIVNAGYLGNSFCYFVDRQTGAMIEHHREGLPFQARLARELWNDHCRFRASGYRIDVQNRLEANHHTTQIEVKAAGGKPGIHADLEFLADLSRHQPLEVTLRLAPNRPAYSHKMACPARGRVRIGDRAIELNEKRHLVLIDVHKAYYPYQMTWLWASGAGFDEQGRVVGFNLTHNCVADDEENNENGLWAGEKLSMFGAARFSLDEAKLTGPWRVETSDGRCKLDFHPEGERAGKINLGVVASDYHQPFGVFRGEAVDDDGKTHVIRDYFGVTEFHRARF